MIRQVLQEVDLLTLLLLRIEKPYEISILYIVLFMSRRVEHISSENNNIVGNNQVIKELKYYFLRSDMYTVFIHSRVVKLVIQNDVKDENREPLINIPLIDK